MEGHHGRQQEPGPKAWPVGYQFPLVGPIEPVLEVMLALSMADADALFIPVGEPETNEEMGEDLLVSHPNDSSWSDEEPKETVDHSGSSVPPTATPTATPIAAATTPAATAATEQPLGTLLFHPSYLCYLILEINVEVQLIICTMRQNAANLSRWVSLAHEQIIGRFRTVNNQATAISALTL